MPPVRPSSLIVWRTTILAAGIALATLCDAAPARADNTLNSNEKPDPAHDKPQPAVAKDDFTIVPVAGGSTDIGVGGGFFSALTRNQQGREPYVWNIEAAWFTSLGSNDGALTVPYNDGYAKLTVTRFLGAPMQLVLRPSFTDEEALYYYGMGNASSASPPAGQSTRYFQYGRVHPSVAATLSVRWWDHLAGEAGVRYTASWLHVAADSKLADDERAGGAEVQRLIGPTAGLQSVLLFDYGLQLDTRDNETSPHRGTWDEVRLKLSPGGAGSFDSRFGEVSAVLRGYVPLLARRAVLAVRAVGDVLFGNPPFVELPRFEDGYALGGSTGVRGIPGQRYYGRLKVFGNIEVRARFFDFHLFKKAMTLGGAVFFDGGRVWADLHPHAELDGTAVGLKYGVGAGLRLASGTAFVLRGDIAWSPDATPVGAYVSAGEMF